MLNELIQNRDNTMHNYYLEESIKNLGLYNRSVNLMTDYVNSDKYAIEANGKVYSGIIDTMQHEYDGLTREAITEKLDISDVDLYTIDFELDTGI